MKNFPVKVDGKTYWISRSIAIAAFLFAKHDDELYILANQRGSGTPDFQGYWNCPCGYLDFDETLKQCVCREVMEETGVSVNPDNLHLVGINDSNYSSLEAEMQNVTARFIGNIPYQANLTIEDRGGEHNEVSAIQFIPVKDIDNYKWAFNHKILIKKFAKVIRKYDND